MGRTDLNKLSVAEKHVSMAPALKAAPDSIDALEFSIVPPLCEALKSS
jgi:hypothetical protein